MPKHRETLTRRVNPGGKVVWVARYTTPDGRRVSSGSFKRKGPCDERGQVDCCARHAIDAAYPAAEFRPVERDTVGTYALDWTDRCPRSARTDATNAHRISRVLDVEIEGRRLRDWPLADLRRRHANDLVDYMLREQGRSVTGARNILRSLSAMAEDAIGDEVMGANPFKGARLRDSDRRATKVSREPRIWSFEEMHAFAASGLPEGADGPSGKI